jgi:hypothetical protein
MPRKTKSMEFAERWVADFADLMGRLRSSKTLEASATSKLLRSGFASVQFGSNAFWERHGPRSLDGLDEAEAMLSIANHAGWLAGEERITWGEVEREFPEI